MRLERRESDQQKVIIFREIRVRLYTVINRRSVIRKVVGKKCPGDRRVSGLRLMRIGETNQRGRHYL